MGLFSDALLKYCSLQLCMAQILRYYFTTVKSYYLLKAEIYLDFHWETKVCVERNKKTKILSEVFKTPQFWCVLLVSTKRLLISNTTVSSNTIT